jgi:SAM-dependent methyltransferase
MFVEESLWIKEVIGKLETSTHKKLGNVGSSSLEFRTRVQPHVHENVIASIEAKGFQVVNIDLKNEEGVDVVGDITAPSFGFEFHDQFDMMICTNLLEHVVDISLVIQNLIKATKGGGYILITVPYRYRIHLDPIDNGFRPTPREIAELFKPTKFSIVDSKVICIENKLEYKVKRSRFPFWGYRERILFTLGMRYKVSGILLQVNK